MSVRIIQGDCMEELRKMQSASVHCCVTSPPYWGLRDYGVSGQLGLESTPAEYVEKMVAVFREVRRVLRDDATLWLNLGDSYATGAGKAASPGGGAQGERFLEAGPSGYRGNHDLSPKHSRPQVPDAKNPDAMIPTYQPNRMPQEGLKPKDLCEIPSDVVRALRADGWWLRSRIPWLKRNAMPESTKDRPTTAVEYVFLLSKSERYYYDGEAVKIKAASGNARGSKTPDGWDTAAGGHGSIHRKGREKGKAYSFARETATEDKPGVPNQHRADREDVDYVGQRARRNSDWFFESWQGMLQDEGGDPLALIVNPQPFKEAHFATFPPALIEPCILAGCPNGGVVLDPFGGAGTTGLVADRLQRDAILIELNPAYADMAKNRIHADAPLFSDLV